MRNLHSSQNAQYRWTAGRFFHLSARVILGFATGFMGYSIMAPTGEHSMTAPDLYPAIALTAKHDLIGLSIHDKTRLHTVPRD
jgi:hypothetical protein